MTLQPGTTTRSVALCAELERRLGGGDFAAGRAGPVAQWTTPALIADLLGLYEAAMHQHARLLEALRRYGRHEQFCPITLGYDATSTSATASTPECRCGLSSLLADAEQEGPSNG